MWFFHVDWRFTALLGVAIQCVDDVPDDCDNLVNELLLLYPVKPAESDIAAYLMSSVRVRRWFNPGAVHPAITRFNLDSPKSVVCPGAEHPVINTVGELAGWLNISTQELDWFMNLWRREPTASRELQHYQYQLIEKRDGRLRLIESPKNRLKRIQRKIYDEIIATIPVHPAAHGYCKGRSCVSHAVVHQGKQTLLLFDIAECFQSIRWPMVKAVFKKLGYTEGVCVCLTALCTHSVLLKPGQFRMLDSGHRERLKQRHLPQGAPSSPALANAALNTLDKRLSGLAHHLDADYSRYADDIVISSDHSRDWRFLEPLIGGICLDEGVALNYRKSRIIKTHQKQRIVGIVVNHRVNIDRKYFDTLKATLMNCRRHGVVGQNRHGHTDFRAHLHGKIQYVKSLNHTRGHKLEQIYKEINW